MLVIPQSCIFSQTTKTRCDWLKSYEAKSHKMQEIVLTGETKYCKVSLNTEKCLYDISMNMNYSNRLQFMKVLSPKSM